ncbi:hypothetical protein V6L77_24050 [Pannonibacter sp. Pt2-lr]|uniref:Uncharacterized protein n=1 Tax=Pannonibacter anstelovis TaxID=3121537 RepID=A0ABU7ZIN7_9HYPH
MKWLYLISGVVPCLNFRRLPLQHVLEAIYLAPEILPFAQAVTLTKQSVIRRLFH